MIHVRKILTISVTKLYNLFGSVARNDSCFVVKVLRRVVAGRASAGRLVGRGLGKDVLNDIPVHVGQSEIASGVSISQAFVVQAWSPCPPTFSFARKPRARDTLQRSVDSLSNSSTIEIAMPFKSLW